MSQDVYAVDKGEEAICRLKSVLENFTACLLRFTSEKKKWRGILEVNFPLKAIEYSEAKETLENI